LLLLLQCDGMWGVAIVNVHGGMCGHSLSVSKKVIDFKLILFANNCC